ncbi:endonuclease/exonuclease/phosphatase family domain-containing protein 1-like [Polyodon spathula]|uniref:endonuclease/exonuclease/phosphatase family domain-containing protein 1-like n=1 Tax=Polyodon spathula TaxID=7913 RepID=UPI001B7EFEF6|nr:endonuclease/exonuclease/phosphatase family domain-containing protein 1-like [Polyodon spathula]
MGQSLGNYNPVHKTPRRSLKNKRQLSAACNFVDLLGPGRVDLNRASEEELMTLHGVDRSLARDIVAYRTRIGGFRKVEDLALVTGVGAARMAQIQSEVFVGEPGSAPNLLSLDLLSCTRVDINRASLGQIQRLAGVTEEVAQGILFHRTTQGPFWRAEELGNIKGVDPALLARLLPQITVGRPRPAPTYSDLRREGLGRPNAATSFHSLREMDMGFLQGSVVPVRPLSQPFSGVHNGRPVLRVASWNLREFGTEKAQNPGVREVICRTLLENGIQLLAVQEVLQEEALEKVCLELEKPSTAGVREWPVDRGTWRYVLMDAPQGEETQEVERVAFLWDCSSGLELLQAVTMETQTEGVSGPHSQPLLGSFKMGDLEFSLINLHLRSDSTARNRQPAEASLDLLKLEPLKPFLQDLFEKALLTLGHLGLSPDASEFAVLREQQLEPLVPADCSTELTRRGGEGEGSLQNIWASHTARDSYTGRWGVIRLGLSSPWIPDGWSWGGIVSTHCPVWVELYMK